MANAGKIGLRRAAWIMLEEGTLLSIRRPKAAFAILQRAAQLLAEIQDFIGELIADLSLGLLAAKLNKPRSVKRLLHSLQEGYGRLGEQEPGLPPWSALVGCVNDAISGENPNSIFNFLNNQFENLVWRPMLTRMLHCLAWDAAAGAENAALSSLRAWVNSNYGRHEENGLVLPADFDFQQNSATAETGLSEIECLISTDKPFDLNFPLGSPVDISWKTQSMTMPAPPVKSRQILNTSNGDATGYQIQSQALPPEIYQDLQQEIRESSEDLLPLKISFSNSSTVAAPWEAIFAFSASETEEDYYPRFMYRRVLERAYVPRTGIMPAPAVILGCVADNYIAEMASEGWNELASDDRFLFNVFQGSDNVFQGSEINQFGSGPVCLLYLVGVPIEVRQAVSLEIISTDLESADVSSYAERINHSGTIIEAASLAERFPQLRLVVVQCPPRYEESRTRTDRFETAKMRRFCADVFQTGVGAVVMLPPLTRELSVKCLNRLAELFASPVEVRLEDVMRTMREIQELIAAAGHSDKNDAVELSFDVCLYLHDSFEWHVV